jgi:oxaloacetate decarboxylase beta subunit
MSPEAIEQLLAGVTGITWQSLVMFGVAGVLLYLAIVREYEPLLLLPIASGCLLANLPLSPVIGEEGLLTILYDAGIENELFPLLIFIGIGAMTDFGPLLENPRMILLGAAGQFGIFGVLVLALLLGFSREEAASGPRPSTSAASSPRISWGRSQWPPTATWPWSRSSCRRS